uniref:Uncharacterized protein n=1 Tax=Anser cygnoides TaxID=8845 RepID=A0A8B9ESM0_ANSCY
MSEVWQLSDSCHLRQEAHLDNGVERYVGEIKGGLRPAMRITVIGMVPSNPKSGFGMGIVGPFLCLVDDSNCAIITLFLHLWQSIPALSVVKCFP